MKEITYPVHEVFHTFQGEGSAMGLPAFFIRLFGCPVKCSFCDSAGTWHPTYVPKNIQRRSPEELNKMVMDSGAKRVVITGGEPAIFDLGPLTECLEAEEIHLETSGAFPIRGDFDWIVLSPKHAHWPTAETVEKACEFKLIISTPNDIEDGLSMLKHAGWDSKYDQRFIWLHPEWSQRNNPEVLQAIAEAVKGSRFPFRAGWQIHKLYRVDQLDNRSLAPVPLGGDEAKGY